jgi:hypothetical protein
METQSFDQLTVDIALGNGPTRRTILGGLLAGGLGLLTGITGDARKKGKKSGKKRKKSKNGKKRGKKKSACKGKTRCNGKCVNTDTDSRHCGACGVQCASGEQCIHGRCYSPDICPAGFQACPDFQRCSVENSDCFCGTTTGGQTVCFQDENFCDTPRPCVTTSDCEEGRVCLDSTGCCEARDMPAVNRTCVLPCENKPVELVVQSQQAIVGKRGPGRA